MAWLNHPDLLDSLIHFAQLFLKLEDWLVQLLNISLDLANFEPKLVIRNHLVDTWDLITDSGLNLRGPLLMSFVKQSYLVHYYEKHFLQVLLVKHRYGWLVRMVEDMLQVELREVSHLQVLKQSSFRSIVFFMFISSHPFGAFVKRTVHENSLFHLKLNIFFHMN